MDNSLKITALQPEVLVRLLKQAGSRTASPEMIAEDLASGAPRNPDGTINLIEYARAFFYFSEKFSQPQNGEFFKSLKMSYFHYLEKFSGRNWNFILPQKRV